MPSTDNAYPVSLTHKIGDIQDILAHLSLLRLQGKKIVFTNGCFDLLHPGHVIYLTQASALGDYLVVGINSDASVRRIKGMSRPVVTEHERALVLSGLSAVDFVVIFDESTPIDLIQKIQPHIHVKGGDYQIDDLPETPFVRAYGGDVRVLPFVPGCSTSALIYKITHS